MQQEILTTKTRINIKKLLIISLFALLPLMGKAQYFSAFATETSYSLGDCKLVRSWNTRGTVSVHEYTTGDRFVYTDFAGQCATIGVPFSLKYTDTLNGLRVNDMVIVDDYVFFCGMANVGDHGVIGYFKVTQFFSGTINVVLHEYSADVSFKKLVAYPDNLSYTVVALGSKRVSSSAPYPANDFIVEEQDILSTPPTPINIKYVQNTNTGPLCEYYHDMVLTNGYIVLVGCFDPQQLCLRMADRSNVLGPLVNQYYFYPAVSEITGDVVASAIFKDSIAVAYVHPAPNNKFTTRIRTIEIPSMTNTYSQEFNLGGKINPWDMIYSPMEKKLVLLMPEVNAVYPYSEFIRLDPYPTGTYTTESTYNKFYIFKTLDLFMGYDFVSSCANTWYFQNLYAPLPTPTGECPQDNSIKVEIISNINVQQSFPNANPDSVTVSPATYPLNVNNGNLQLDCKHIWRNEK